MKRQAKEGTDTPKARIERLQECVDAVKSSSADSAQYWAAVQELWRGTRHVVADIVARRISQSFEGRFDESGRPHETYDEMKAHATEVRDSLAAFGLAIANPQGEPCQLFAQTSESGGPRYMLVAHGTQSHTVKRSDVVSCLLNAVIVDRPMLTAGPSRHR